METKEPKINYLCDGEVENCKKKTCYKTNCYKGENANEIVCKYTKGDRSGYMKTPNGCWYHIGYVELIDVDIKTGKFIVKALEDRDFERLSNEGRDLNLSTSFDFDYTRCIDTQHKEIELTI